MCTSPIRIYTNSSHVNPRNFLGTMEVPCGHCPECQSARHSNYKTRCYYETLGCEAAKGVTIFDTFTYCDECLPRINNIPCFNHSDIINFKKRLRINLTRDGYILKDSEGEHLRYFIVCEYGSTTHRPHYHGIFWCTAKKAYVNSFGVTTYRTITPWQLHTHLHKAWEYGFTDKCCKQIRLKDKGVGAIHYVTKYMTKSVVDTEELAKDLQAYDTTQSIDDIKELMKAKRQHFSLRCWASNGLGSYFLQLLEDDLDFAKEFDATGKVRIPSAKGGYDFVPLGHYYTYKLFYERVFNPHTGRKDKFVLTPLGLDWKCGKLEDSINSLTQRIEDAKQFLPPAARNCYGCLTEHGYTPRDLAVYALVYRGKCFIGSQYNSAEFVDYMSFYRNGIDVRLKTTEVKVNNPAVFMSSDEIRDWYDTIYNKTLHYQFEEFFDMESAYQIIFPALVRLSEERRKKQKQKDDAYERQREYYHKHHRKVYKS